MSVLRTTLALCGAAVLAAGGCGSDSLSGGSTTSAPPSGSPSSAPAAAGSADPALAAALPPKLKSAGKIVVGVDSTYPPNEFLQGGKTVAGMDVDLFNAVAAKFGLTVDWQSAGFDTIITGVQGGKYDVGVSSFTINPQRKQQVNMVSYFNAGTQWAAQKGNPKGVNPDDACGKTVAVQKGTTQLEDDIPKRQAKCKAQGKPEIKLIVREKQDQATADVASGKADAMLADSPVVLYAAKQSQGQLEPLGTIYDAAPYGYVVPKGQTAFAAAMVKALQEIRADGTYKNVLTNWGNESGAISNFAVNP
ncbi:polar amino acid transport system substrate-binding protein [Kribbella amoyensis]|uniref:Polar amino acid transport system substrate-binding protein n=1 Tax=Kribbella amoyensis TaxID=996641 RepID=A0A561B7Y8_9ACTN|nr:ABC transporter substrate-binding protein [Kribbella amoyensis]TWD74950.1 polar amino acid transport system substrate-binding protein [Kribbella amoyensis]